MSHEIDLVLTLTGALAAALALGLVAHRLRLSPVVGYLVAGIVVGPFTPGFVAHQALASQLAEIGVVLLMFGVGLHFELRELVALRGVVVPGALAVTATTVALATLLARAVGFRFGEAVLYALCLSVASTVVLVRVLEDFDALHRPFARVAVAWLVVEDLFTILLLVVLPAIATPRAPGLGPMLSSIGVALAKLAALLVVAFLFGRYAVPRLLAAVSRTRSRELFTLTVLVVALGIAVAAARVFGASMALGAFLAGIAVAQTDHGARAASEALPFRDAFAVLFFVSIGMLLDPRALRGNLALTMGTLAIVLLGKPLAAIATLRLLGKSAAIAVPVGLLLAQIGEFSFVLSSSAGALGLLPAHATQPLVVVAVIAIALDPFLFRLARPLADRFVSTAVVEGAPQMGAPRVVVVGFGPVGQTVARLLVDAGIAPTIVEMSDDGVARAKQAGLRVIAGDAAHAAVLEAAGVHGALGFIFAASGSPAEPVRVAKELEPSLIVLARTTYLRDRELPGASSVVVAELEVALAMTERLLSALGASGEQLDRARDRVRAELLS